MISDTHLSLEQSEDISQLHQNSAAYDTEEMVEIIEDSNPAAAPNTASARPASLRKIMDRRYSCKTRPQPTKLAPVIVSTPASKLRSDAASTETYIMKLVKDMKSTSPGTVREAISELRLLAKDMANTILIAGCGAIGPLVDLLPSSDQTTQEHAVTTLLNLCIDYSNKVAIAKANAIEPLIHVLRTGSPEARENSAAALSSLSVFEENNIRIGKSGAIAALVDLLENGTPQGKKDAATALFNLSTCNKNRPEIVKAGAVNGLIKLMDPATGVVDRAVAVLANLATIPEGKTAIAEAEGVPLLVEAIELCSMTEKQRAVGALVRLCLDSNRCRRKVLEEGVVPSLVILSKSGTPKAQEKANRLLGLLRNQ